MKFIGLKKHLAEEKINPCYLVSGEDIYLVKKAAKIFRELAADMPEFNLHVFSENAKALDIVNACKALPIMNKHVVVEVNEYAQETKIIEKYLESPSQDSVLVFISSTITKNLTTLSKVATVVDCERLDAQILKKWVVKRVSDNGCKITDAAANKLVSYCDRFMSWVENETEKLSQYKLGGTIEVSDVEQFVSPSLEYKIYQLGDAILLGKRQLALSTLRSMQNGMPSSYIISGLYTHFRRLLYSVLCKDNFAYEYLGVKEFAVTAARRQASTVSPKKLKAICDSLQEAEYGFKSGKIGEDLAIETIVTKTVFEMS